MAKYCKTVLSAFLGEDREMELYLKQEIGTKGTGLYRIEFTRRSAMKGTGILTEDLKTHDFHYTEATQNEAYKSALLMYNLYLDHDIRPASTSYRVMRKFAKQVGLDAKSINEIASFEKITIDNE